MKAYESLKETLSFYGVQCNEPYYISSGNPIFEFPKKAFRIDFYAFCICASGKMEVEIDNHTYHIGANSFLISAPSTIIRIVRFSKDFRMKLLFFDKIFLLRHIANPFFIEQLALFRNSTFSVISPGKEHSLRLFAQLNYLGQQTGRKGRFIEDIIRTIMIQLLLEIATLVDDERGEMAEDIQETNNLFFKFTKLVQENAWHNKDVQFYADKLFISNKYLISIVKKTTGKTPHEIIDETLLKEVCVLLGNPEKTISQIALDTGFSSTSSFGRFFKKYVSISPQEYRKHHSL
ncbi:helix-turn-helix domain-containing protein [Chitinophaga flava]|uniref:AraC family transcriptional regulator n=1 Tax=Chitinophaga flava TaxID=2259036 RepID=A0A365XUP1_9BACT|nr:AraC family transcriptional regulator [Chitinophaga flava]RBL90077.1 AraC family transcriptional regulator [Chitinophaga flava]